MAKSVLPKTTPPPNEPRIGVADMTNARAVLGTVPVEAPEKDHQVMEVVFPGYTLGGRVLRPAMVRVGTYESSTEN